ncbi:MAG TPA: ATP-binding cassette domain-containing protein, partial [Chloroflexota bacterium]|nr:ATP-binding cassette domain-containing protein [Chloroflexota bacterium]
DDVLALSDRVTVLKNGIRVATLPRSAADKNQLIHLMIGEDADVLEEGYEQGTVLPPATESEVVLETIGLRAGRLFQDISLQVRRGEILGIYGYMGAGHFELGRSLFGVTPAEGGAVWVRGKQTRIKTPAQAKRLGIAYLPENRKSTLLLKASLTRNITITFLERIRRILLHEQTERRIGAEMVNRVGAYPANAQLPALSLSGGNQQKVALAKWIRYLPTVLILTEPTRGMDVGAKKDVLDIIQELKREGVAVILISSEPETVMAISDRILVVSKGRIMKEFVNMAVSKDVMLSFG